MKIRGFPEEFRSLPTNAKGSRKRVEDVYIYLRVQGPETRVQSPVQSRVQSGFWTMPLMKTPQYTAEYIKMKPYNLMKKHNTWQRN